MLSSRSCSTPLPGLAVDSDHTAICPISRSSIEPGMANWLPTRRERRKRERAAAEEAKARAERRVREKGSARVPASLPVARESDRAADRRHRISRPPPSRDRGGKQELQEGATQLETQISHGAARRGHGSQAPAAAAMRRDDGGWLGGVSGRSQDGTAAMRCQHSRLPLCLATAAAASSMAQTWAARCRSSRAAGSAGAADARVAFGEGGQHRRRR
jgi:hypothetical protein